MIAQLEQLLGSTGHAPALARDIMALRIYGVDVRIIADDSGSMNCGMLREVLGSSWNQTNLRRVFGQLAFCPRGGEAFESCPFGPASTRWALLRDAMDKWEQVFQIMDMQRRIYFLNDYNVSPNASLQDALRRDLVGARQWARRSPEFFKITSTQVEAGHC